MAALYPAGTQTFNYRTDLTDYVMANDVNVAYAEIAAVENTLGSNPQISAGYSGSFSTSITDWGTVASRIQNLEYGTSVAVLNRVSTLGGSTIASSGTTVGLTVSSSGTGNLFVAGNTTINNAGYIAVIDGGNAS
jgi:hypothetical protein